MKQQDSARKEAVNIVSPNYQLANFGNKNETVVALKQPMIHSPTN